jgi:hypothetical protein
MLTSELDHIVLAAASLEAGVEHVHSVLGIHPGPGGRHGRMGTHNAVLRLGEALYLEVLAVDPAAPSPGRPRWFGLDRLGPDSPPRLAAWVVRTNDLGAAVAESPVKLGQVEPMSRAGLRWLITVPADGMPPSGGVAPAMIQWLSQPHPAGRMDNTGCRLAALEVHHPEAGELRILLDAVGFRGPVSIVDLPAGRTPYLVAHIDTPSGRRQLSGDLEAHRP